MTELFGRLYLDENVFVILADMIRSRGCFAITARDVGLLGIDDDAIHLSYATSHGLCIVTHDRHLLDRVTSRTSCALSNRA